MVGACERASVERESVASASEYSIPARRKRTGSRSAITFRQCCHADTNDHCWLTPRTMKLRSRLAAMRTNAAAHNTTSIARRYVAVGKEIPMPVARATYAATHTRHLGSSASVTLGTTD